MIRRTLPVLVVVLAMSLTLQGQSDKIRVYLAAAGPAPSGFVDTDSKRIADSRIDFLNVLRKDKGIAVVESPDGADVLLSIVSSKLEAYGTETETRARVIGGGLSSNTTEKTGPTVRVKLTAGEYEREFKGGGHDMAIVWKGAAGDAAIAIRNWIKENRSTLLAKRAQ